MVVKGRAITGLRPLTLRQEADAIARPLYKLGDLVDLTHDFANQPRVGPFEITRLMPLLENGEGQYRVRGPDGRERAVDHHEIAPRAPSD